MRPSPIGVCDFPLTKRITATDCINLLKKILASSRSAALEGLAAGLVEAASNVVIRRAASGSQSGADAGGITLQRTIRVEAKRYSDTTRLSERELVGEVAQAIQKDPQLEAWILVTTREVPEQLVSALQKYGIDHGVPIFVLDWSGSEPILAKLCAACPDVVKTFYGAKASAVAKDLAGRVDADFALESLSRELQNWSAGWAITATWCRDAINEVITTRRESKARFRQDLAILDVNSGFVTRDDVAALFSDSYSKLELGRPFVVIGEEGVGKSWALANWLHSVPDAGTVIAYCSSSEFVGYIESTVENVLAYSLSKRSKSLGIDYWQKRIERLKDTPDPASPIVWLVIDGLNEATAVDWSQLFVDAQRGVWVPRLRLVVSCRTRYFEQYLKSGLPWVQPPVVVEISRFKPDQRDGALSVLGIDPTRLSASVLELALVPRICRLVAATAKQLEGAEHVTFERILFEYGKRFDSEARNSLSDDVWHSVLRNLARAAREGMNTARLPQLREWIDVRVFQSVGTALDDIIDGHLIRHANNEPGVVEFNRDLVLVANGFALWRLLETSVLTDRRSASEVLAGELDPLGGVDERPRIVAAALAAAAMSANSLETIRPLVAALVVEGITGQNAGQLLEQSLTYYSRTFASSYLDALSTLGCDDRLGEADFVCWSLQSVADAPHVQAAILDAVTDWMKVVDLDLGDEVQRPESQRLITSKLIRRFGKIPDTGDTSLLSVHIEVRDDGRVCNLPFYALRLAQHCKLATLNIFWREYAVSRLFGAVNTLYEHATWIVRLNRLDYDATCSTLKAEATFLASQQPPAGTDQTIAKRAGAHLLWLVGDDTFDLLARGLVPEPDNWSFWKKELDSPTTSGLSLYRSHVTQALDESSQSAGVLVNRASKWWADPGLDVPSNFVSRLTRFADGLGLTEVRAGGWTTADDINLSSLLPALARCSSNALSTLSRRIFRELGSRKGEKWARLASDMTEHWLIVSVDDCAAALRQLERTDIGECDDGLLQRARLVLLLLAQRHNEPEQFPLALLALSGEFVSNSVTTAFGDLSVAAADHLLNVVRRHSSANADWIFVNVLASTNTPVSEPAAQYLLDLTRSPHKNLRLYALYILANLDLPAVAKEFVQSSWSWRTTDDDIERRHVSRILLASDPPLSLDEVLTRIPPWRLPAAAHERGSRDDARIIARTITELLSPHDAPLRHPYYEQVVIMPTQQAVPLEHLKLEEQNAISRLEEGLNRAFELDARLRDLKVAEREILRLIAAERGGIRAFYGEWIRTEHLATLVDAAPEVLDKWLSGLDDDEQMIASKVRNASGFYLSLCQLLLQRDPERGVVLWNVINRAQLTTQFLGEAGLDMRLLVAFRGAESKTTLKLWNELWDLPRTNSDSALFEVILAAESTGRSDWLAARIADDAASRLPWRRDRARMAAAFRVAPELDETILHRLPRLHTHTEGVEERAAMIAARAVWQRHWLTRYFTEETSEAAYASFILFLEVADKRWRLIDHEIASRGIPIKDDRSRYLRMRLRDIESATKKFDDSLRNLFLGQKIQRDLWPWTSAQVTS